MVWFLKKFFTGRIKRINYFSSVLTLVVFVGIISFAIGMVSKLLTDRIYVSRADLISEEQLKITYSQIDTINQTASTITLIISIFVLFLTFSLAYRRLHDFNAPGILLLVLFLQFINEYFVLVNVVLILILLFKKGDLEANKYGSLDKEKDLFRIIFPK